MHSLPPIILLAGLATSLFSQSPHGTDFNINCADCHSSFSWEIDADTLLFDHGATAFPLAGRHTRVDCRDCHQTLVFPEASPDCISCHTDIHRTTVGSDCARCHTPENWLVDNITELHQDNGFPLLGAHAALSCNDCHVSESALEFNRIGNDCINCHLDDFNASTNPNHQVLGLPTDCTSCHSTNPGWSPASFDTHGDYYALNGAHAAIAGDCAACHNGGYNNTPNTCAGCHIGDYNQTTGPGHAAAQFPTDCESCHTETAWAPANFDHDGFYPLTGAHTAIADDCVACHNGDYDNTPNTCAGCHMQDYNQSANPGHQALGFPTDCASCHTTDPGWAPATFDIHNDYYVLNGAHAAIASDCAACHNGDYANTPNTCAGCHAADYNQAVDPNHAAAQFPTDCEGCHTESQWIPSTFDHDGLYFPIYSGKHDGEWSGCIDCHANPSNYAQFSCTNCHANPQTDGEHAGVGGYVYENTACLACHPAGDAGAVFDHNMTAFPLTGAHASADCLGCHAGGYEGTSTDCASCHAADFSQAADPDHNALGLPTDCASCHSTNPGWSPASFDIHGDYYALNGAHAMVSNDCAACHNGGYNNTPNTCAGCHTDDYNQTTVPDHQAAQFPVDCESCHSETAWAPSAFDHGSFYPLTGAHTAIADDCVACHNGDYDNTPNTCAGCHAQDYNQSANPNHQALGFPTDCASCHTTDPGWSPAAFDIHNDYYVLAGAHAAIAGDCAACHNGDYMNTPNTCAGCHIDDYNQTANPNHAAAQFPTDCEGCHAQTAWAPSTFDHNAIYPFAGAHVAVANDCAACHNGDYTNTPNTCAGCHTQDYNQSANPNHQALGFPTDCASCHTTDPGWSPAAFDIHNDYYVLAGAHAAIAGDCAACHNGDYSSTPNTCFGCHANDYNQTANPNHAAAQFPTDCESCHVQTAWVPASFNHDDMYFPIYDGKHEGEWNNCVDCHTSAGNFSAFSCIDCHEHDDPFELGDKHEDVPGYVYQSNACYACHPTGEKD